MENEKIYKLILSDDTRDEWLGYSLLCKKYPEILQAVVCNKCYTIHIVPIIYADSVLKILPDFPGKSFVHPDFWSQDYINGFKTNKYDIQ